MRSEKRGILVRITSPFGGIFRYLREDILIFACLMGIVICTATYFDVVGMGSAVALSLFTTVVGYLVYDGNRSYGVLVILVLHIFMIVGIGSFSVRYSDGRVEFENFQQIEDEVIDDLVVIQRLDGHGRSTYTLFKEIQNSMGENSSIVRFKVVVRGFTRYRIGNVCRLPKEVFIRGDQVDPNRQREIDRYLRSKDIQGTVYSDRIECLETEQTVWIDVLRWINDLKRAIESEIYLGVSEPKATLLLGMIFGDEREYQDELNEGIRLLGLSHVVAASGSNVSYIENSVEKFLGKLVPAKARYIIKILALCIFAMIAGLSGSVLRAVSTRCVKIVAQIVGRRVGDVRALVIASSILLVWKPNLVDDVGFQLSVVAVLGLAVGGDLYEIVSKSMRSGLVQRGVEMLGGSVLPSFICTVFTIPVTYFRFGAGSLMTIIPNVLILPLLDEIFTIGIIATIFSTIWGGSISGYLWNTLDLLLSIFVEFVEVGADLFVDHGLGSASSSIIWFCSISIIFIVCTRYSSSRSYYLSGLAK